MAKKVNLVAMKRESVYSAVKALGRYDKASSEEIGHNFIRWVAQMTAVEIHTIWERYVEERLVAALNHNAKHFLEHNDIKGVSHVSTGFAYYIVRGGGKYFDFRSTDELIKKADSWLGKQDNPFRKLDALERKYIDTLSAIRNCVVHGSDASLTRYKSALKSVYGIKAAPEPDEFLNAKDFRPSSIARRKSRLFGLVAVIVRAIHKT